MPLLGSANTWRLMPHPEFKILQPVIISNAIQMMNILGR